MRGAYWQGVFALPFALVGLILASYRRPIHRWQVGWAVAAFAAAWLAAVAARRAPEQRGSGGTGRGGVEPAPAWMTPVAWAALMGGICILVYAAWRLNPLCLKLAPVAVAWVFFYGWHGGEARWSHLVLGAGLAMAPVGGYVAVAGRWGRPWWMLVALAAAVMAWVAGFDLFHGLARGPAGTPGAARERDGGAWDQRRALRAARLLHALTIGGLAAVGLALHAGMFYWVGVGLAAAVLAYGHSLVTPDDVAAVDAAFLSMNGMLSLTFCFFVLADRVRPLLLMARHAAGN